MIICLPDNQTRAKPTPSEKINKQMRLYTRQQTPTSEEIAIIGRILSVAKPPLVFADLFKPRPTHIVSSWRSLTAWYLNRKMKIPQETIADWLALNRKTVHRAIRVVDGLSEEGSNTDVRMALDDIAEKLRNNLTA